jgi:hypothetical protein
MAEKRAVKESVFIEFSHDTLAHALGFRLFKLQSNSGKNKCDGKPCQNFVMMLTVKAI